MTETESVYCTVRAECLNVMRVTVLTPYSLDRTKENINIRRLAMAAVKLATVYDVM
jgi:hypothetical protein